MISGWWYTYPSEKYEFVSWDDDIPIWKKNVPNHQSDIHWSLLVLACEGTRWYYRVLLWRTNWWVRPENPGHNLHHTLGTFFFATLLSFILKPKDPHPGEGSETPRISEQNKCKWKWHRHAEARYRWTNTPVVSKRHIPSVPMKPPVRWPVSQ